MSESNRREFLGRVGQGMLITSLGPALANELGAAVPAIGRSTASDPTELETLVGWMHTTSAAKLQPKLVTAWRAGTKIETLVAAGAIANARTFGGMDYQGFHAFMALMPAYRMSQRLPKRTQLLPVLKVLYRNTDRIQVAGRGRTTLRALDAVAKPVGKADQLRAAQRKCEMAAAEADFARRCERSTKTAFNDLQWLIQDSTDVHRVVLPWRAWDMLQLTGSEYADPMLRQCVRYCVDHERSRVKRGDPEPRIRKFLPKLLDQHRLLSKKFGSRQPEDAWLLKLADTVFGASREQAADAVAAALAEGFAPEAVGEAITLAANQLLMHTRGDPNKRDGVHGASIGVHASDAANAWRNIARVTNHRNRMVSLVVAAYHTAGQVHRVDKKPLAFTERGAKLKMKDPEALLREAEGCIRNRDQAGACAAVHRYADLGHPHGGVIDLMLKYAISEDGALHAEKYFHTAVAEFATMRTAFRWRQLIALARVTASEFGETAPGYTKARALLES